jgi:hypothetical protein
MRHVCHRGREQGFGSRMRGWLFVEKPVARIGDANLRSVGGFCLHKTANSGGLRADSLSALT